MADPLDYFNRVSTPTAETLAAERAAPRLSAAGLRETFGGRGELIAVPAEFDALLDATGDAATTAAIEAALRHADVPVFRGRDASARGGAIELHVRSADLNRAGDLARSVIERRARFRG